jgi:Cdc6-like AAA superfamily ATPase
MSLATATYSEAKKALNASAPERVICRAKESDEIKSHLLACFKEKNAVSIYVNGQPGTGKTLLVNHILDTLKVS